MLSSFSFSEDTVGFLLEGTFGEETVQQLHDQIREKLQVYDTINLYLEDSRIETFSLTAVIENLFFKLEHKGQFNKVALVSDRKWIHLCGKIEKMLADINVKSFVSEDRMEAITWIAER